MTRAAITVSPTRTTREAITTSLSIKVAVLMSQMSHRRGRGAVSGGAGGERVLAPASLSGVPAFSPV